MAEGHPATGPEAAGDCGARSPRPALLADVEGARVQMTSVGEHLYGPEGRERENRERRLLFSSERERKELTCLFLTD